MAAGRGITGLLDGQERDDQRDRTHRPVDEKDPAPVHVLADDAADERAEGQRRPSR
jgi:hypothetical protein